MFGILGTFTAYEWIRRRTLHYPPLRRIAPLLAGVVLLGWLGMGGRDGRTDVMAHVLGFAAGVGLGSTAGVLRLPDRLGETAQLALGILAGLIPIIGWIVATAPG